MEGAFRVRVQSRIKHLDVFERNIESETLWTPEISLSLVLAVTVGARALLIKVDPNHGPSTMELSRADVHDDTLALGSGLHLDSLTDVDSVFAGIDGGVWISVGVDALWDGDVLVVVVHVATAGGVLGGVDRGLVGDGTATAGDGGA